MRLTPHRPRLADRQRRTDPCEQRVAEAQSPRIGKMVDLVQSQEPELVATQEVDKLRQGRVLSIILVQAKLRIYRVDSASLQETRGTVQDVKVRSFCIRLEQIDMLDPIFGRKTIQGGNRNRDRLCTISFRGHERKLEIGSL